MIEFLLIVPVLLLSVVVHEVAHAWQALREGDPTARDLGRITLNPVPHLDLVGSIIVPLALHLLPGNFLFGWARPVPVNPRNYRNRRAGDIRVSLAGIVANLGLVVLFAAGIALLTILGGVLSVDGPIAITVSSILRYGVLINLILAYFNLIPIPPLDGSHVLYHLLPPWLGARYRALGRYGIAILLLMLLVFPQGFATLLSPVLVAFDWTVGMVSG